MIASLRPGCPDELPGDLMTGRSALAAMFDEASPRLLRAGQPLASIAHAGDVLYRLKGGCAYRFCELSDGNRAIVDIYLPGDIMGFDAAFYGRPIENVLTLATTIVETITSEAGLSGLMTSKPVGLYIAWLLNEQQRRTDSLRTATAALDARGRLAAMVLDFYHRLEAQGLITNSSFNLPLTQHHIGSYLGLTVVHVNRVIRCLRDDGVVNIEKHCVTLLNLKALASLAKVGDKDPSQTGAAWSFQTRLRGSAAEPGSVSGVLATEPLTRFAAD
jgi:CRP/FNR family transcriptional regulator, anaerobic regulatory protein